MNYLNVIDIISRMEEKILQAKLVTYTRQYREKDL